MERREQYAIAMYSAEYSISAYPWENVPPDEKRLYLQMADAVLDLPAAQEWQDISTAPKDGTDILAYAPLAPDPKIRTTFWRRPSLDYDYVGWGEFNDKSWPPTHWMPLPAPPVAVIAEERTK